MMIEIPLNSNPEQLFSIVLEGETYDCRVAYSSRVGDWAKSFSQNGVELLNGVPLLGGVDILKQHNLPIKNMYTVNLDNQNTEATSENLGTVTRLFILTEEEIENG